MINLNDLIAQNTSDNPQKLVDLGLAKQIAGDLTPTHSTPDNIVVQSNSEDGLKSIPFQRLLKLIEVYQLDPLKEDPSRIWFEIDVATEGDFKMGFAGGRAWLDTTELTTDVAVPNVVGKHVVVIENGVTSLNISSNRLKGDLVIEGWAGQQLFVENDPITSLSAPDFVGATDYMIFVSGTGIKNLHLPKLKQTDSMFLSNNALQTINIDSLSWVTYGLTLNNNQLTPQAIEYLLNVLLNVQSTDKALNISEGTNAPYSAWSQQAKDDFTTLQNAGWTITYNE